MKTFAFTSPILINDAIVILLLLLGLTTAGCSEPVRPLSAPTTTASSSGTAPAATPDATDPQPSPPHEFSTEPVDPLVQAAAEQRRAEEELVEALRLLSEIDERLE